MILEFARMESTLGDVNEARKLYELGVSRFPSDDRIWDRYIDFEKRKAGGSRVEELVNRRNLLKVPLVE